MTLRLSPLQGEGGLRGERGEPGEKGRDGAPVSTALSPPPGADPRPPPGTDPVPVSCSRASRVREGWPAPRGSR